MILVYYAFVLFRVSYRDGVMEHEPKACAAVKGTQIMVSFDSLWEFEGNKVNLNVKKLKL